MLSGSSETEGVTHFIVVLFTYIPTPDPNLPNLHSIPYCPTDPFEVGIAKKNDKE
jgi:hypothetical protein